MPPPLFLVVNGGPSLNPSDLGEPLPTLVKVLQLRTVAKLETLEPSELFTHTTEALGPDLVSEEEFTLEPGERVLRWINRQGPTNYLVAMALFRAPQGPSWRAVMPLAPVDEDDCPSDAPPPRTGNPRPGDLQVLVNVDGYQIAGGRIGARR